MLNGQIPRICNLRANVAQLSKKSNPRLFLFIIKMDLSLWSASLHDNGVKLYSTAGTQTFIENLNIPVTAAERADRLSFDFRRAC